MPDLWRAPQLPVLPHISLLSWCHAGCLLLEAKGHTQGSSRGSRGAGREARRGVVGCCHRRDVPVGAAPAIGLLGAGREGAGVHGLHEQHSVLGE